MEDRPVCVVCSNSALVREKGNWYCGTCFVNLEVKPKRAEVIIKPWGREIIYALTDKYCGKILEIKKNERLSLQLHKKKKESIYCLSGLCSVILNGTEHILSEGRGITINPQSVHRFKGISDVVLLEVSSPEINDLVRLEDDYNRD